MPDITEKSSNGVSLAVLALFSAFLTFYGVQYQSWERQMEATNRSWEARMERQALKIEALEQKIDTLITENGQCNIKWLDLHYKYSSCQNDSGKYKIMEDVK
jgi:hypothetical protein